MGERLTRNPGHPNWTTKPMSHPVAIPHDSESSDDFRKEIERKGCCERCCKFCLCKIPMTFLKCGVGYFCLKSRVNFWFSLTLISTIVLVAYDLIFYHPSFEGSIDYKRFMEMCKPVTDYMCWKDYFANSMESIMWSGSMAMGLFVVLYAALASCCGGTCLYVGSIFYLGWFAFSQIALKFFLYPKSIDTLRKANTGMKLLAHDVGYTVLLIFLAHMFLLTNICWKAGEMNAESRRRRREAMAGYQLIEKEPERDESGKLRVTIKLTPADIQRYIKEKRYGKNTITCRDLDIEPDEVLN